MKKELNLILILFLSITLITSNNVYAEEIDISNQYEKYEQLNENAKNNIIKQNITGIRKDNSYKSTTKSSPKLKASSSNLPSSYNLKDHYNITVKNQESTGSCWAFAYTTAMETTYYKTLYNNGLVLSPLHIDYTTANIWNRTVGDGGNNEMAQSYLASNYGPVSENSFRFSDYYNTSIYSRPYYLKNKASVNPQNFAQQYRVKDMTRYPSINKKISGNTITYTDDYGTEYTQEEVQTIRNKVKNHIYTTGAVTTYLYMDNQATFNSYTNEYTSIYYDKSTYSYYYDGQSTSTCPDYASYGSCPSNHLVTIVGWDDNYVTKANNKGAYIILNSWGTKFGQSGYFYVPYDDVNVEVGLSQIDSIDRKYSNEYTNKYEYDDLGNTLSIIPSYNSKIAYAANSFTRNNYVTQPSETLKQIGVFISNDSNVEIYVNPNQTSNSIGSIYNMQSLGTYTLTAGYHVINVSNYNIKLTGKKYAIVVKYINQNYGTIPLEVNYYSIGMSNRYDLTASATSNYGESFISTSGISWTDAKDYLISYTDSSNNTVTTKLKNANACIKAFTSNDSINQIISNGVYKIASSANNSYVLDVAGGSKSAGANIQLYKSNDSNAQRYVIEYKGNGYYLIQNVLSIKNLEVKNSSTVSGTNVWQNNYNGKNAQLWFIEKTSSGTYKLHPKTNPNNLSLNMTSGNTNKANVNVTTNINTINQEFKLIKDNGITGTKTIANGRYIIQSSKDTKKVLDIKSGSKANKANVQLYKSNNSAAQKFIITYRGNGYYSIINVKSNKSLDVKSGSTANKANVWQYTYNGSCAQLWIIKKNSNGTYTFINRCSRKVIDLNGGKTANKTNVQIYTSNNSKAQQFKLKKV